MALGELQVNDSVAAERAAARYLAAVSLGAIAVLMGWFAYIDAPITDAVMLTVAIAVGAGVVAALAAIWAYAIALGASDAQGGVPAHLRRLRRVAMLALSAMVLLAAIAMVATLNVRGEDSGGNNSSDEATDSV